MAGVEDAAGKPVIDRLGAVVEHRPPRLDPVDAGRRLAPESLRIGERTGMNGFHLPGHRATPSHFSAVCGTTPGETRQVDNVLFCHPGFRRDDDTGRACAP